MKRGVDKRDKRGRWQQKQQQCRYATINKKERGQICACRLSGRWRRNSSHGGTGCTMVGVAAMMMTTRRRWQCRHDDDAEMMTAKTTAVARVGSNAGRGHGGNNGGDVAVPSGTGRRKARREVGAAGGCGVGFIVDYYLQVCPLTPF